MKKNELGKGLSDAKSQLHAAEVELEALRRQVRDLEDALEATEANDGISKRDIAKAAWIAPIVVATNLPNTVFAQNAVSPVGTQSPTPSPTDISDLRLKKDIAHIANLNNEIGIYAFKYLWDDTVRVGVMAQDLLLHDTLRQAVVAMPSGYYSVDYAMLGLKMAPLEAWLERGKAAILLRPPSSRMNPSLPPLLH